MLRVYGQDFMRVQKLIDPLLVGGLFWLVSASSGATSAISDLLVPTEVIIVMFTAVHLRNCKVYESYRQRSLWTLIARITEGWFHIVASLLIVAFFAKVTSSFSRIDFITWSILGWALLTGIHVGGQKGLRFLRSHGGNSRDLIFWGTRESAINFFHELNNLPYLGLRLIAWYSPDPDPSPSGLPHGMPPSSGGFEEMEESLQTRMFDQIYFSETWNNGVPIEKLITLFGNTCKPVFYVPAWTHPAMNFNTEQFGGKFMVGLWESKRSLIGLRFKRVCDFCAALVLIAILSPLLVILAILIRLGSPGPVLFCQDRAGLDGRRFKIYKFRTMYVAERGDQPALRQATKSDPRVTPIGRVLRKWSLDELPQLFNVVNGSMSLVGPRPHAISHNELYRHQISGYMQRHMLRPGITGLAQVDGLRGETAKIEHMVNRVEADLQYLKNWSIRLDIRILMMTFISLRSSNAY
jgi:putative colanic acid biosysnthesis UDP-glucose lipid carrier transferase